MPTRQRKAVRYERDHTRFRTTSTTIKAWTWAAGSVMILALFGAACAATDPTTRPGPTLPPVTGKVVLSQSGSANVTTPNFTVTDPWTISYAYDCGRGPTTVGFSLTLNNIAGTFADDPLPVLAIGPQGAAAKVEHSPGTYSLQISSTCHWTLRVTT